MVIDGDVLGQIFGSCGLNGVEHRQIADNVADQRPDSIGCFPKTADNKGRYDQRQGRRPDKPPQTENHVFNDSMQRLPFFQ